MIEQGARRYGDHEHELEFPATIRPLTAYERSNKGPREIGNHKHKFEFPATIMLLTTYEW